jgi:lipopolysaccharide/colanic/teichoic acid biosynthesis glycosyltransferase/uncharacterized membrane protein
VGESAPPARSSNGEDRIEMTSKLRHSILVMDLLWVTAACLLANLFRFPLLGTQANARGVPYLYAASIGVAIVSWTAIYWAKSLDGFTQGWHFPSVSSQVIVASTYLIGSLLIFGFLMKFDYSLLALFFLGLVLPTGLVTIRFAAWKIVKSRARTNRTRRVVILGNGRVARELADKIQKHPEMAIQVVGFLYPHQPGSVGEATTSPAATSSARSVTALALLQEKKVQELILTEPLPKGLESDKFITSCHNAGMRVHFVPQSYELYLSRARLSEIDDVPLISIEPRRLPSAVPAIKRTMDIVIGGALLLVTAPLLCFIYVTLRTRRIGMVKEPRCGQNGVLFWMYRFNVDRWAPDLAGIERFLAKVSLTELPQLWNVLRGDMAVVGPRPESPERVKHYSAWQRQRLSVKQGLTGLAQVYGLREHHSSEQKARFDLQYIYHWSLFYDFSIVLQTVWTLVCRLFERNQENATSGSEISEKESGSSQSLRGHDLSFEG